MSKSTAGILLCGILSDSLNLKAPATTKTDILITSCLTKLCEIKDLNYLVNEMFKAKASTI